MFLARKVMRGFSDGASALLDTAIARYTMDTADLSGSILSDVNGSNDLTLSGTITTGVAGKIGEAFSFSFQSSDRLSTSSFTMPQQFTVICWIKPNTAAVQTLGRYSSVWYLRANDTSSSVHFLWDHQSEPIQGFRIANSAGAHNLGVGNGVGALTTGSYNFVALSFDGTTMRAYTRNASGVLEDNTSTSLSGGSFSSTAYSIYIGNEAGGDYSFDGDIDETLIFDTALSTEDLESVYDYGA